MTEQEWLECRRPGTMLQFVADSATDRRLRLFACAAARGIWRLFPGERNRLLVTVSEEYADGLTTKSELKKARKNSSGCEHYTAHGNALDAARETAFFAAYEVEHLPLDVAVDDAIISGLPTQTASGAKLAEDVRLHQCALVRDIFNPFRSVTFDAAWVTVAVKQLSKSIYDDRAFDRLPILADALEEAGCADAEILNHCRSDGVHVRGCWVVDLLLGKQ